MNQLYLYNSISRRKEAFEPLHPPFVGMYVCGPTVYGDAHLGHARPAITFDVLFRYLQQLNFKVRYVRNITDVGHLENDADDGEDKIAKKARLEQLEPMEIAQHYTVRYRLNMSQLNVLPPSIEPLASGHIIEQIKMIETIINAGFAYVVDGSVYFDVLKYNEQFHYGKLSGRVIDDLLNNTRELEGQQDKRNPLDFALWKKANPEHIMRWASPWSEGFPGWHIECSAMSSKYLGQTFDIHGGGMDLMFPHHECEIAQSTIANKTSTPVRFWLHNNMITINGQKMGKSLGNFITLNEIFEGKHRLLSKAFEPMTIRFFILQAHYRSTLDFSDEALLAAEKGLARLMGALENLAKIQPSPITAGIDSIATLENNCYKALNDDLNTPMLIAHLFDYLKNINNLVHQKASISENDLAHLTKIYRLFLLDILGLQQAETKHITHANLVDDLMQIILNIRQQAKANKDFATADKIREDLTAINISIKDTKNGTTWTINN